MTINAETSGLDAAIIQLWQAKAESVKKLHLSPLVALDDVIMVSHRVEGAAILAEGNKRMLLEVLGQERIANNVETQLQAELEVRLREAAETADLNAILDKVKTVMLAVHSMSSILDLKSSTKMLRMFSINSWINIDDLLRSELKSSLASRFNDDNEADVMITDMAQQSMSILRNNFSLDTELQAMLEQVVDEQLFDEIQSRCGDCYDSRALQSYDTVVSRWLLDIDTTQQHAGLKTTKKVYDSVYKLRCSQLFDIIVDYPDSMPALQDIKDCLESKEMIADRRELINQLNQSISKRLLRPAAKTRDILDQYIATIRCLVFLDPTGLILQSVAQPIRLYLRNREDTVKHMVSKLFALPGSDDEDGELADELKRAERIVIGGDDVEDDWDDPEWMPVPSDIGRNLKVRKDADDILSSLVNIYDSVNVFVKEYQNLLSTRLLSIYDYNHQREVAQLEMLKSRFGESLMQKCAVMVKDIEDSRRVDSLIHERHPDNFNVHTTILSRLFWPTKKATTFSPPVVISKQLEEYEKEFSHIKRSRKLTWLPDGGNVELELTIAGKEDSKTFNVSPVSATIISFFGEKETWSVAALSKKMKYPELDLKSKLQYWASQGIIRAVDLHSFTVVKSTDLDQDMDIDDNHHELHELHLRSSVDDDKNDDDEQMATYWTFIVGMLTNLGSLPVERIHMMLGMFVQAPAKYDCTQNQLKAYLTHMVRDDKLELVGEQYRLKK